MTQRYKAIVAYNGNNYHGWALQAKDITIQQIIHDAFKVAIKANTYIYAASRTDAKVNASGQVFHFDLKPNIKITCNKLKQCLNLVLPYDIRIMSIKKVAKTFNARFDAKGKTYLYKINVSKKNNPSESSFIYQYNKNIDLWKINKIKKLFLGKKNFLSFSTDLPNVQKNIKEIKSINISKKQDIVTFKIIGNSFLRSMVRMIIGCFLAYNENKVSINQIKACFSKPAKGKIKYKAPACGLTLQKIWY